MAYLTSTIISEAHHHCGGILEIHFVSNTRVPKFMRDGKQHNVFFFKRVPKSVFETLVQHESPGRYFAQFISRRFKVCGRDHFESPVTSPPEHES